MRAVVSASLVMLALFGIAQEGALSQEPPPELVGPLTQEQMFEALPDWQDRMVAYEPRLDIVAALKDVADFVQIEVYLGSWCSDSAVQVPDFIQVMNLVNSPRIQAAYTGVPEAQDARGPYIAGKEIEKIPTFIVLVNGLEKGRIVEKPAVSIEEDLLALIRL